MSPRVFPRVASKSNQRDGVQSLAPVRRGAYFSQQRQQQLMRRQLIVSQQQSTAVASALTSSPPPAVTERRDETYNNNKTLALARAHGGCDWVCFGFALVILRYLRSEWNACFSSSSHLSLSQTLEFNEK